jgi:hypothetical protein
MRAKGDGMDVAIGDGRAFDDILEVLPEFDSSLFPISDCVRVDFDVKK